MKKGLVRNLEKLRQTRFSLLIGWFQGLRLLPFRGKGFVLRRGFLGHFPEKRPHYRFQIHTCVESQSCAMRDLASRLTFWLDKRSGNFSGEREKYFRLCLGVGSTWYSQPLRRDARHVTWLWRHTSRSLPSGLLLLLLLPGITWGCHGMSSVSPCMFVSQGSVSLRLPSFLPSSRVEPVTTQGDSLSWLPLGKVSRHVTSEQLPRMPRVLLPLPLQRETWNTRNTSPWKCFTSKQENGCPGLPRAGNIFSPPCRTQDWLTRGQGMSDSGLSWCLTVRNAKLWKRTSRFSGFGDPNLANKMWHLRCENKLESGKLGSWTNRKPPPVTMSPIEHSRNLLFVCVKLIVHCPRKSVHVVCLCLIRIFWSACAILSESLLCACTEREHLSLWGRDRGQASTVRKHSWILFGTTQCFEAPRENTKRFRFTLTHRGIVTTKHTGPPSSHTERHHPERSRLKLVLFGVVFVLIATSFLVQRTCADCKC